jgi:hypothetical protein
MKLKEELKKPINMLMFILTILSILLSIIFYFNSKTRKEVSYLFDAQSSLIYDSNNSSPNIEIYEKDTVPIKGNVYIVSGIIWNSGDITIDKSDIRLPLKIEIEKCCRILDYKITNQHDITIAKFNLMKIKDNSLLLGWNFFDPGYGFKFQLIYNGEKDPKLKLNGKILDIDKFNSVSKRESIWSKSIMLISVIFLCFLSYASMIEENPNNSKRIFEKSIFVITLIETIFFVWLTFFHSTKIPF